MDLSGINIWEILVAAVAPFAIGFLWYGKPLFGKTWQGLVGLSDEDMAQGNMPLIFGVSYLLQLVIATFLSFFIEVVMMVGSSAIWGGLFAVLLCLAFVGTTFGTTYLFSRKPQKLYWIDLGYQVVAFFVMGFIIGAWK